MLAILLLPMKLLYNWDYQFIKYLFNKIQLYMTLDFKVTLDSVLME